ncbi:MAG: CoA transferase [Solirubrobacterales bacterium]
MTAAPGDRAGTPLAGIRVLECSSFLAGPVAAMMLADLGADVVKVEPPEGDFARGIGPQSEPGTSAIFAAGNRGKRSIAIDLSAPRGRELVADLAAASDVVVHNRGLAGAERLGLAGPLLRGRNPDAVACTISAFGSSGPYATATAIDPVIQAMTGMMALTGEPDGTPMRAGPQVIDVGAGVTAAASILAALLGRERGGGGADVEIALLDVGLMFNASFFPVRSIEGADPPRLGNRSHPLVADQFATADGLVVLGVWDEARWRHLCELLGRKQWLERSAWAGNDGRLADYPALRRELEAALADWKADELVSALRAAGIASGRTLTFSEVLADRQITESGGIYKEQRLGKPLDLAAGALRFGGQRLVAAEAAPHLGEHSAEVLRERLGLGAAQIDDLVGAEAVVGRG